MASARISLILRIVPLLILVRFSGLSTSISYGDSNDTTCTSDISTYEFDTDQSHVIQTGGFAGVHEIYPIEGYFQLYVDFHAEQASFELVDANLLEPTGFLPTECLNELFNMTELTGIFLDDTTVVFVGKANDAHGTNTYIVIIVTLTDDMAYIYGQTIPPVCCDFFYFDMNAVAKKKYSGGTGEPNDPYLIYTAEQLNTVGAEPNDWDKHFKLMEDIDLAAYIGTEFNIIGVDRDNPFTGVFDGNGHTISNFNYSTTDWPGNAGLFGRVERGTIKDLGLVNPVAVTTLDDAGSLVGWLGEGTISNCHIDGASVSGVLRIGGLVGTCHSGSITNCYSTGTVNGDRYVGGLVGENRAGGIITNCYSTGDVSGDGPVGGLVGHLERATIINSYSTGTVSGNQNVGGLVGLNFDTIANCYSAGSVSGQEGVGGLLGSNSGIISNCYSVGSVTGTTDVGGLVGTNDGDTVTNCFWDTQTSGQAMSACGTGLTTAEMQTENTFIAWGGDRVWTIDEGVDYPRLLWENKPGKLITKPSPAFGGGSGTEDDPYLIYIAEQLNTIGLAHAELGKRFKLMADIDLADYRGTDFNIIGSQAFPFSGVFDGNGKKILNFNYTHTTDNVGLFGYVSGANARIEDLWLIDPNVASDSNRSMGWHVGSLVGRLYNGIVADCHVENASIEGRGSVGGLVGYNSGTITNCTSSATVGAMYGSGCLVGENDGGISECSSSGEAGAHWCPAGLVGSNSGVIFKCYSSSEIQGDHHLGGLVGLNDGGIISNCYSTSSLWWGSAAGFVGRNSGTISNCYSVGSVSGRREGGLVLENSGTVTASFWDIEISGLITSDAGTGLTTAEMYTRSTFTDAGWDFNDIWKMWDEYDYPRLVCEPGPNTPLVFVDVNDPNFYGQMSKYEVTNDQYCDFLNAALASGDITINDTIVEGADGSNSGEDYVGESYYKLDGLGWTGAGATSGGAARIHYNEGTFSVDDGFGNHPVTYVSWYGAMAFANYYSYYLPAEDQWQAVADYDGTYIYGCGETIDPGIANYRDSENPDGTTSVGSYGQYGYDMSDMAGNVWEWTSSGSETSRIFRGGSWSSYDSDCDVSIRGEGIPYANYYDVGFRVCR